MFNMKKTPPNEAGHFLSICTLNVWKESLKGLTKKEGNHCRRRVKWFHDRLLPRLHLLLAKLPFMRGDQGWLRLGLFDSCKHCPICQHVRWKVWKVRVSRLMWLMFLHYLEGIQHERLGFFNSCEHCLYAWVRLGFGLGLGFLICCDHCLFARVRLGFGNWLGFHTWCDHCLNARVRLGFGMG